MLQMVIGVEIKVLVGVCWLRYTENPEWIIWLI